MSWQQKYAHKIVSAQEAAAGVRSGQSITVGMYDGVPPTITTALTDRAKELEDVGVFHFVSVVPFFGFDEERESGRPPAFRQLTPFCTNVDRDAVRAGKMEYLPFGLWRSGQLPYGVGPFDYHLCVVSPPDDDGWCSFGGSVWMNPTFADNSASIIAEVKEDAIRTGGANKIHIDRIDTLVEQDKAWIERVRTAMERAAARTEEETAIAEVVCTLVGMDLVNDGDTVQIGAGAISAALGPYLAHRKGLGIHTELLPGGVVPLVQSGVVTGQHKTTHPGKVLATGVAITSQDELDYINGNDTFELYDFTYTDDITLLVNEKRLVAVNNGMQADLTGQVNGEAIGPWPYTGPGGQTAFAVAAAHSDEGRSVIVLPSSYEKDGVRHSRIKATLDEAAPVTTPRSAVDYIVTEWGIATMRGKTIRQRIGELIAIAHPDCKEDLKKEANRIYGWSF